jgi:hypothetical protein
MAKQQKIAPPNHHYVRTIVAAMLGSLAMLLVTASILVTWANHTLTDTNAYVQTVGTVLERPGIQDVIANKLTDQILASGSVEDLASKLLSPAEVTGKTPEQLEPAVRSTIHDSVVEVLKSPQVQQAWKDTNRSLHTELIRQLDAGAPRIELDITPLETTVIGALKQSKLAPIADKLDDGSTKSMVIGLAGKPLEQIRKGYRLLKAGTMAVVALTLLLGALAVWASVHHLKTLRRMLVSTGTGALLAAGVMALPSVVQLPTRDPEMGKLAADIVATLLHGLQLACLWIGIVCVALALGSKLYERRLAAH